MNSKQHNCKIRYVLGIDPSGNFFEGKGITGWSLLDRHTDKFIKCGEIKASKYSSQQHYWLANLMMVEDIIKQYKEEGIVVSIEDFVLYAKQAKAQVNSAMETSQLIGILKMACFLKGIPYYIRTASHVKRRWADSILCVNNYIYQSGRSYYTNCVSFPLCDHIRDSMRHAVHCSTFELREENL